MVSLRRVVVTAACLTGLAVSLSACAPMTDQRGWHQDTKAIDAIHPGVDNKASVAQALGTPSSTSNFNDRTWYYISQTTDHLPFQLNKSINQQVVEIQFDQNGVVSAVKTLDQDQGQQVAMNPNQTHFLGTNATLWQEIFGNIGRFNAPSSGSTIPGGGTSGGLGRSY